MLRKNMEKRNNRFLFENAEFDSWCWNQDLIQWRIRDWGVSSHPYFYICKKDDPEGAMLVWKENKKEHIWYALSRFFPDEAKEIFDEYYKERGCSLDKRGVPDLGIIEELYFCNWVEGNKKAEALKEKVVLVDGYNDYQKYVKIQMKAKKLKD